MTPGSLGNLVAATDTGRGCIFTLFWAPMRYAAERLAATDRAEIVHPLAATNAVSGARQAVAKRRTAVTICIGVSPWM